MRSAILASGFLLVSTALAVAAEPANAPVGTVTIVSKSADLGVGASWGHGTLHFKGHNYGFSVKGVDVAAVGYSKVVGHGRVYKLATLHDFDGTYAAANGAVTLGTGKGGQVLENSSGVQIEIVDMTKGARLAGAAQGIEFTLDNGK
jgi:hypothetical protein